MHGSLQHRILHTGLYILLRHVWGNVSGVAKWGQNAPTDKEKDNFGESNSKFQKEPAMGRKSARAYGFMSL